jgi:ATP-grasp domain
MLSDRIFSTSETQNPKGHTAGSPRILLADTNRGPVSARLAVAFSRIGSEVAAICPIPGHPIQKAVGRQHIFHYSGFHPLTSLKAAIEAFDPDIVVPTCDRSVRHLHELHSLSQSKRISERRTATLIERSLGPSESFQVVSSRYELLKMARSEGILVPDTCAIDNIIDLKSWSIESATPCVIKSDGTWGGRGVRVAHTAIAAERHFLELTQRAGVLELAKRLILNRDRGWVLFDWQRSRPEVIAQSLIDGRPANCAVACWQGRLLAGIAVEVVRAQGVKGPATVVQVVEGSEMMLAAERIARGLRLSGFFGLDFMIETGTGATYLIEMNPRCTPPCPLPLGIGHDLVAAMWAQLTGQPLPESQPVTSKSRIAYFPHPGRVGSDLLDGNLQDSSYYDIPSGEPALMRELLKPWSDRSLLGQIIDRSRLIWTQEKTSTECVF